ncbi:hypothetical protein EDB19DRAFT_286313 [Suillus lakei]|nr:hypothetical protein EDB19DRAFT_286313 [Suillus lakei]
MIATNTIMFDLSAAGFCRFLLMERQLWSIVDYKIARDTDVGRVQPAEQMTSKTVSHLNNAMQHFQMVLDQCPVSHLDHATTFINLVYYFATSRELKRCPAHPFLHGSRNPWPDFPLSGPTTNNPFSLRTTRAALILCYLSGTAVNRWLAVRLDFVGAVMYLPL